MNVMVVLSVHVLKKTETIKKPTAPIIRVQFSLFIWKWAFFIFLRRALTSDRLFYTHTRFFSSLICALFQMLIRAGLYLPCLKARCTVVYRFGPRYVGALLYKTIGNESVCLNSLPPTVFDSQT